MRNGLYNVQFVNCTTGASAGTASGTATGNSLVVALPSVAWDMGVTAVWSGFVTPVIDLPGANQLKIYPNPLKQGSIYVSYELVRPMSVSIDLFDVSGNKVADIFQGIQAAGTRLIAWQPVAGRVAPGVYFMRLSIGQDSGTQKVIIYQ
jgi:hypothetical protein